jgi:hypothetical protein
MKSNKEHDKNKRKTCKKNNTTFFASLFDMISLIAETFNIIPKKAKSGRENHPLYFCV